MSDDDVTVQPWLPSNIFLVVSMIWFSYTDKLYIKMLGISFSPQKQDSKESSPRLLDKMLLKLQVNSKKVQKIQLSQFFQFSKSSKFLKCTKFKPCQITSCHSKDFKLVLNTYDQIWYDCIILCQMSSLNFVHFKNFEDLKEFWWLSVLNIFRIDL